MEKKDAIRKCEQLELKNGQLEEDLSKLQDQEDEGSLLCDSLAPQMLKQKMVGGESLSIEGLLEQVTAERDNLRDAHERSKREMLNHSLEVSLAMKEEIEVLREETE